MFWGNMSNSAAGRERDLKFFIGKYFFHPTPTSEA